MNEHGQTPTCSCVRNTEMPLKLRRSKCGLREKYVKLSASVRVHCRDITCLMCFISPELYWMKTACEILRDNINIESSTVVFFVWAWNSQKPWGLEHSTQRSAMCLKDPRPVILTVNPDYIHWVQTPLIVIRRYWTSAPNPQSTGNYLPNFNMYFKANKQT